MQSMRAREASREHSGGLRVVSTRAKCLAHAIGKETHYERSACRLQFQGGLDMRSLRAQLKPPSQKAISTVERRQHEGGVTRSNKQVESNEST